MEWLCEHYPEKRPSVTINDSLLMSFVGKEMVYTSSIRGGQQK